MRWDRLCKLRDTCVFLYQQARLLKTKRNTRNNQRSSPSIARAEQKLRFFQQLLLLENGQCVEAMLGLETLILEIRNNSECSTKRRRRRLLPVLAAMSRALCMGDEGVEDYRLACDIGHYLYASAYVLYGKGHVKTFAAAKQLAMIFLSTCTRQNTGIAERLLDYACSGLVSYTRQTKTENASTGHACWCFT